MYGKYFNIFDISRAITFDTRQKVHFTHSLGRCRQPGNHWAPAAPAPVLKAPSVSIIEASTMKLNIIYVSLTLPTSKWLYFSISDLSIRFICSALVSSTSLLLVSKRALDCRFSSWSTLRGSEFERLRPSYSSVYEFLSFAWMFSMTAYTPAGILTKLG